MELHKIENKVVHNACYGGFGLSEEAKELFKTMTGFEFDCSDVTRHDRNLVKIVETLGEKANSAYADLEIKVINSNKYYIDEYDGFEEVWTPYNIEWIEINKGLNNEI